MLIAPLDWGLGHTTRCIPVIKAVLQRNCKVFIACNHWQQSFLEQEFNNLIYIKLEGYNIEYSKKRLFLKIASQGLKIRRKIAEENLALKAIIADYKIDWIISDNRYGLFNADIFSTIITHQLQLQLPDSLRLFQPVSNRFISKFLKKFDLVWVPDNAGENNMGGQLSHTHNQHLPIVYLGSLGRFKPVTNNPITHTFQNVAVILSGIEPQRSILESIIIKQIKNWDDYKFTLVRGINKKTEELKLSNCNVINRADSKTLEMILNDTDIIISRSGYSSVMDYLPLNKSCIFIPTPGQTEQEYLASYLEKTNVALSFKQPSFNLSDVLKAASVSKLQPFTSEYDLDIAIDNALMNVIKRKNG